MHRLSPCVGCDHVWLSSGTWPVQIDTLCPPVSSSVWYFPMPYSSALVMETQESSSTWYPEVDRFGRITFQRFISKCFIFKCVSVWGMKTANASLPFVLNYTHLDFTLFLKKYQVLTRCPRKILLDTALMHLSASQKCHCLQREVAWAHCPDTCPHGTGRAGVQWFSFCC